MLIGEKALHIIEQGIWEMMRPLLTTSVKFFCPPKEIRSYGRIDSDENEILYAASSKNTALNELKIIIIALIIIL